MAGTVLGLSLLGAAGALAVSGHDAVRAATATPVGVVPTTQLSTGGPPAVLAPPARQVIGRSAAPARPTAIGIPALGVLAPVDPVAADVRTGELDVPADVRRVGWWDQGPAPGSRYGTVVITGHIDAIGQGPGVLARLRTLSPGSAVDVAAGRTLYRYVVVARREYDKADLPADVFSPVGVARLVIVSCGGPFDERTHHYRDNIVVYAVPRA